MISSRSPRKVLLTGYRLARKTLPDHTCRCSRHDFTLAQLFACLVLREFYGLSYRRVEQLLCDSPQWLANIGMTVAPDHNTLWRAMGQLLRPGRVNMLDLQAELFLKARLLRLSTRPLAMDSTCFEQRHRSSHYDRRCRQMRNEPADARSTQKLKTPLKPGSWGTSVNISRSHRLSAMPKLSVAVASGCHLILAAKVRTGNGSDAPDFDQLLYHSWKRAPVKVVVVDAGYDSESNRCVARDDMGVRSIISLDALICASAGPRANFPVADGDDTMAKRSKRKADQKQYAQRAQSETVHSMIKRNQGSALRSKTPERREAEMFLRALTHNIMLMCDQEIED